MPFGIRNLFRERQRAAAWQPFSRMGEDKPNPLTDTLKGLGLLFRAARTVAAKIPTKNLEEVVTTSARQLPTPSHYASISSLYEPISAPRPAW